MERLFFECTVRAALLVAGTAIALYTMQVKAAAAKHAVWTGIVALMLMLPIWTAWGPQISLRLLPPLARRTANEETIPLTVSTAPLPPHSIPISQAVLLGAYLLGLGLLLARLGIGTIRSRRLIRGAVLRDGMHTSSLCVAPVTVGFHHPTVILPEQWPQWPPAQLDAVLTHEHEHARRRDALVQWLALLNRALFWFHPAAWWLERHLSALAEEVCDNVVLERGHNPGDYCEYLIDIARSVTRAATRVKATGMAMPGSSLPRRISRILEGGPIPHISRTRMACVGIVCALTCTAFAAGTLDHARQGTPPDASQAQRDSPTERVVLSEIFVSTASRSDSEIPALREKADGLLKRARDGENFGELAKQFSDGSTAKQGGDLGSFERPQLAPNLWDALSRLNQGGITDVLSTKTGFLILQVRDRYSAAQPSALSNPTSPTAKFVLGDLRIEGDVHDRDGVRNRILKAFKDREYDDAKKLADDVMVVGIRADFQKRGYFKVVAHDPVTQSLGLRSGRERILITTPITEGDQFRLGALTIQNVPPDRALSIPAVTLRDQFHIRSGDLFNVPEIREGLGRLQRLYAARGYAGVKAEPDTEVDNASHHVDLIVRITEGLRTP